MDSESLPVAAARWTVWTQAVPRSIMAILAAGFSGVLLALPYNYPDLYLLTWIAFVPLLWVTRNASPATAYGLGLCTGLGMYAVAAFWIVDFIALYKGFDTAESRLGAVCFWLYSAQLPACLLLLYRWLCLRLHDKLCRRAPVAELWLFPLLVAIFYSYFPMLFPVQLASSQSRFLLAIQATEFFGAASLDFIIALSNVVVWTVMREWLLHRRGTAVGPLPCHQAQSWALSGAAALMAAWLAYGGYAVQRWDAAVTDWPARDVGIVQPDEAPSEPLPPPAPGYSRAYPPEMALTERLVAAGAEVIVWPETRYKGYFRYPHVQQSFSRHMARLGVPLVFQDIERLGPGRDSIQYNTAVLLGPDGELSSSYRKIKRVPFGEYIPLLQYAEPWRLRLHEHLPELFANFEQGEGPVAFAVGDLVMVPLICYEIIFPEFTARSVAHGQARMIVVLSNNGWFGSSKQPYQHLHASVLRSVENRIPMLHVTNNGPSGLVLPSGRLVAETARHQKMAALLTVPVPSTPPATLFNRYPGLFLRTLLLLAGVSILAALWPRRRS